MEHHLYVLVFQKKEERYAIITFSGKMSIVIIHGTMTTPNERKNMIKIRTNTGNHSVFGSCCLKRCCIESKIIPKADPALDTISNNFRPKRSINTVFMTLATRFTTATKSEDSTGDNNDPASANTAVEFINKIP